MSECQWDGCGVQASYHVFNSTGRDSALLCGFHRKVALINLAEYDLVFSPNTHRNVPRRPGDLGNMREDDRVAPADWEQEAAQNASDSAVPIDQFKLKRFTQIDDLPGPRSD